jgi:hypothetical protein
MQELIWMCRDGRKYRVCDMATSHIMNCVRLIRRSFRQKKPWRVQYLARLEIELEIRNLKE